MIHGSFMAIRKLNTLEDYVKDQTSVPLFPGSKPENFNLRIIIMATGNPILF